MDLPPKLSVVIMAYRNTGTVVAAVRSILDQIEGATVEGEQVEGEVEVVVVTSGDAATGAELAHHLPSVRVIAHPDRLLPGAARNVGIRATTGSIVAFLAADCRAEPGWIAARRAAHARGEVAVAGAVTSDGPARPWAWASYFDLFSSRGPRRPAGPVAFPSPAAHGLSYDRSVLERIGPFDEDARVGEDTEAARRLAALGIDAWFEPAIRAAHVGPTSTRALLRDQHRRGVRRARAEAARLHPTTRTRAVLASGVVWARWLGTRIAGSWVNASDHRGWLIVSLPWLAAARAAYVIGWYRERVRSSREESSRDGPSATVERSPSRPRATS